MVDEEVLTRPVTERDCLAGNIEDALHKMNESEKPIPNGIYYLRGGLGTDITIGDTMGGSGLKRVLVTTVLKDGDYDGGHDAITDDPFEVGSKIALLGPHITAVSPESLEYLLQERQKAV